MAARYLHEAIGFERGRLSAKMHGGHGRRHFVVRLRGRWYVWLTLHRFGSDVLGHRWGVELTTGPSA